MKRTTILGICITALVVFAAWAPNANARSSFYNDECAGCHGGDYTTNTCDGCHAHGTHGDSGKNDININATPDSTTYNPGDTIVVQVGGGYRGGWVRVQMWDLDCSIANTCNQSNVLAEESLYTSGSEVSFPGPVALTATVPDTPGAYTWYAGWYGNERDTSTGSNASNLWIADSTNSGHGNELIAFTFTVTGCTVDLDCDDGSFCNGDETCDGAGACQAGTPVVCDDGVGCTDDSCNETTDSCDYNANNTNCSDDGQFCTGNEFCDPVNDCSSTGDPCQAGEVCNEGTNTCDQPAQCGDGNLDAGEACDDGNNIDGDGCQADCTVTPDPVCGDGNLDAGEACDDGNNIDGDGCQADCTVTPDPVCGDGNLDAGEACDDGNNVDGDGCQADCTVTPDPDFVCGDGSVGGTEVCDDGNTVTETGCPYGQADCITCSADCGKFIDLKGPYCGDGTVNGAEACDDGNLDNGDGCESNCTVTPPPAPVCGDGNVDAGEQCDDGNTANNDGCSSTCQTESSAPSCDDGTSLVITEMDYDRDDEELDIEGRASDGTTISIIDSDSGEILAEGIRVREGRWETEIEDIDSDVNISVISSNGCVIDRDVETDDEEHDEERDSHHRSWRYRSHD